MKMKEDRYKHKLNEYVRVWTSTEQLTAAFGSCYFYRMCLKFLLRVKIWQLDLLSLNKICVKKSIIYSTKICIQFQGTCPKRFRSLSALLAKLRDSTYF